MICTVHRKTKRHYSKRERNKKNQPTNSCRSARLSVYIHLSVNNAAPSPQCFLRVLLCYLFAGHLCLVFRVQLDHVHLGKCCLQVYIYIYSQHTKTYAVFLGFSTVIYEIYM